VARGTAGELAERFAEGARGEITLVLGGGRTEPDTAEAAGAMTELVAAGVPRRQAAELVARLTGVGRNALYRDSL
jgi:16S rRNA (cytidine1402-2'-O)-methyltransferase